MRSKGFFRNNEKRFAGCRLQVPSSTPKKPVKRKGGRRPILVVAELIDTKRYRSYFKRDRSDGEV